MIFALKVFILFLCVILLAAYLSLLERKIIGRIQLRLGPSYYGIFGLLQPIYDAIKLFTKRNSFSGHSLTSIMAVCIFMLTSLLSITIIPISGELYIFNPQYGLLYLIIIQGIISFTEMMIGISSKTKYGIIGGVRAYFQLLSAHLPIMLCLICIAVMTKSFNIIEIVNIQYSIYLAIIITPIFAIYFIASLISLNRTPFDFTEGESEIVAGNYVEYGGMLFAMIYLSEYINLIFTSSIITLLFLGGWNSIFHLSFVPPHILMLFKTLLIIILIIVIRATYPRYKQEQVIKFSWFIFCPIVIIYIALFI